MTWEQEHAYLYAQRNQPERVRISPSDERETVHEDHSEESEAQKMWADMRSPIRVSFQSLTIVVICKAHLIQEKGWRNLEIVGLSSAIEKACSWRSMKFWDDPSIHKWERLTLLWGRQAYPEVSLPESIVKVPSTWCTCYVEIGPNPLVDI